MKYVVKTETTTTRTYLVEADSKSDIMNAWYETGGEVGQTWYLDDVDETDEDVEMFNIREAYQQ